MTIFRLALGGVIAVAGMVLLAGGLSNQDTVQVVGGALAMIAGIVFAVAGRSK